MTEFDRWKFVSDLERDGEDEVRRKVVENVFNNRDNRRAIAEDWLRQQQEKRLERRADKALRAAEDAARAAKGQAETARRALIISLVAVAIALIGLFV